MLCGGVHSRRNFTLEAMPERRREVAASYEFQARHTLDERQVTAAEAYKKAEAE